MVKKGLGFKVRIWAQGYEVRVYRVKVRASGCMVVIQGDWTWSKSGQCQLMKY